MRIGVVFVVYRDYATLKKIISRQLVASLDATVVVVDNTEASLRSPAAHDHFRDYGVDVLIPSPANPGYLGGLSFALSSMPELKEMDYLVLANADASVDIAEWLKDLNMRARSDGVGMLAPRLTGVRAERVRQRHYVSKPSWVKYRLLSILFRFYWAAVGYRLLGDLKARIRAVSPGADPPGVLFAPHGAVLVFTRSALEHIEKILPYPGFLFGEEVYLGVSMERLGLRCEYAPTLSYSHLGHGSMGAVPSRTVIRHLREAHALGAGWLRSGNINVGGGDIEYE